MAATNKQQRLGEYNADIEAARLEYLQRTGKKIARGFKETTEYQRLTREKASYLSTREKYQQQQEKAREDYLKRTGKDVARGFSKSPEFKRIDRNRKKTEQRARRKVRERKEAREETQNRQQFEAPIVLASREIYHLVLSYNDKISRAIRDAYQKIKAAARKQGRRVWVTVTFPDGRQTLLSVMRDVDAAFSELYAMGLAKQNETGQSDALFIDATQTDGKTGYHFFVDGYYDRNDTYENLIGR